MGIDGEQKVVADVTQRNQNRIVTYVTPVFIIIGVLATAAFYYYSTEQRRAEAQEQQRINAARARISFKGTLPSKGCRIHVETGQRVNCDLQVASIDPAKRVMNILVQFPQGFHERTGAYPGSLGGASINVVDGMEYLVSRARPFVAGRRDAHNVVIPVPIIIYSTYEFEGQEYSDRSLYYLMYVLAPQPRGHVIPLSLLQCGRLSEEIPEIDFLVDPWVVPVVGYDRNASHSLMFNCRGYGILTYADHGRYRVFSNTSPGEEDAPQGGKRSFSLSPSSIQYQSANEQEFRVESRIVDVGGPIVRKMPLPPRQTPPPTQPQNTTPAKN